MNRIHFRVYLLLLALGWVLSPISTTAQQGTAAIIGDVSDPQGAAVGGAKVTASDASSGVSRETKTDDVGHFQFLSLQPGSYSIRVEMNGFRTVVTDKIEALVSTTQKVTIKLELGEVSQTVTVTESSVAAVNTTDATLGNAFNSRQILALPFEGRDAAAVLSLQPGVTFIGNNVDDNVDTRNGALNGGRSDQANITLDGVDNNDQLRGTAFQGAVRSTLDSIEEFRVTTAGDNADQGRSSGGQVTLITRSGTNDFHGSLYEQNRPTVTAANGWFNKHTELINGSPNDPQKIIRNTFGGALGGPILKDRLFFFGTYEGQRQAENVEVSRNVPGLTLRNGMVSYPTAGGGVQTLTSAQIKQMDQNCLTQVPVTCPLGNGPDPAAVAVFNKYPLPNSTSCVNNDGFNISCYSFSAANPTRLNTTIAKIDYNLTRSGTHRLFVRGNYQTDRTAEPPQFPGQPPANVIRDTSRAIAVGYTAVLSNTLVNSFHYGLTRQSRDNLGIESAPLTSFRFIDDLVPGVSSLSPETSFTTKFHVPVHNFLDDVTWTRGKHTLQIGTNIRLINNVRASDASNFNNGLINPFFLNTAPAGSGGSLDPGAFGFPKVDPNNLAVYDDAIIDLVGIVSQVTGEFNRDKNNTQLTQGSLVPRHFKSWEYDWYAQDSWHVKSNLTVTAGLRYTLLEPPYETSGNQVAPNLSLNDFVNNRARLMAQGQVASPVFGLGLSGQANGGKPYWPYDYKDLGPRFSVAYSPNPSRGLLKSLFGGAGKSSIRAGYGIVYDHFGEGLINTFDASGSFGLTTVIVNPASVQTVDGGARFTGLHNVPGSSNDGQLLAPAPNGPFPFVPPVSTLTNNTQQIANGLDDKLKTPYSELVDLSFTRELPGGFVLELAYVGRFAHRLLQQRDLAMPLNLKDPKSGMDYFTAASMFSKAFYAGATTVAPIPYWEDLFSGAAGTCGAGTSATQCMYSSLYSGNIGPGTFGETNAIFGFDSFCFPTCLQLPGQPNGGLPFQFYNPQFTALYAWSSIGKSSYNAAQVILRSRPTHGLQMDFNYAFSQSLDVCSDAERVPAFGGLCAVINTWAPFQLRAPSDFDARHQLNSNWVYDMPFGQGRKFGHDWNRFEDSLLGGWQVAGLLRWTSGFPFSIGPGGTFPTNFQLGGNVFVNGAAPATGTSFLGPNGDPFAFKLGPKADTTNAPGGPANPNFRFALPGESGQRNNFRGDGFYGLDLSVNKTFRITERHSLRFSAAAFNLTNSVRFDAATISANVQNAATFGQYVQTTTNPRVMEFALRYQF
ncbi:MAG: carboxypeptidase regulatory-like domain-containing protein [Candidatus Acidiferrales bacterium]